MASTRPEIEQRLSALIPRIRLLRMARGAARFVLAAVAILSAVAAFDAAFNLPPWARGLCLSAWITGLGVLAWRAVVLPWRAEITPAEVACDLQPLLPELGERLREAVTKPQSDPPSPVRAAVAADTARRVKSLNLARALPVRATARLAGAALAAALAFASAVSYPSGSERLRRIVLPWANANTRSEFRIHVATGELTVRRGGPVTLSAYVTHDAGHLTPTEATLCIRLSSSATESHEPMAFDGTTFHITLPAVPHDFDYSVEIGGVRSAWFRITAIDTVELADGTQIVVREPAYTGRPPRIASGFTDIDALQFSTIAFRLKFRRTAALAQLIWRPDSGPSEVIPLALASDQLSATAQFLVRQNGTLKLLLDSVERGKRLRTEKALAVRVTPDTPPQFVQLSGLTVRPRPARITDRVRIAFTARDDLAVSSAVLEYLTGPADAKPVEEPIPLTVAGPQVSGTLDLALAGKAADGETIRLRVRLRDNRRFDEAKLGPQETLYPPGGWSELRIRPDSPPLVETEVGIWRDSLGDGLSATSQEITDTATELAALQRDTAGRDALTFDQTARLNNIRARLRNTTAALQELARTISLAQELRALATAAHDVAALNLAHADESLRKAETNNPTSRASALAAAGAQLTEARAKLGGLLVRNTHLAQDRLDHLRLMAVAIDQFALADRVKAGDDLLPRQRELLTRLETLVRESEPLRRAAEAAKAAEVRRLAASVRRLADTLHHLDADAKRTAAEARAALVSVIARDQNALAKQTAAVFDRLDTPCRLAGVTLPRPDDFLRVADLAAAGRTVEALTELEKHAQALEHIAVTFDRWASDRTDPKFATRQLALWQEDLIERLRVLTKPGGFAAAPPASRSALRDEQSAIESAIESLPVLPDAAKEIREATDHARLARKALAGDGAGAEMTMRLTVRTLHRLADSTPPVAERLARTLRAIAALRQELDASSNAVEAVLKGYETKPPDALLIAAIAKKLTPQAERQRKLAVAIEALDLPGLGARRARAAAAFSAAVADLLAGSPLDIIASQAWARRELERLKWAAEGVPQPDETASLLRRKLVALADALDAAGPELSVKLLEPATPLLQEATLRLGNLNSPEAVGRLEEARAAVIAAEMGLRDRPDEARRRIRAAAEAVALLADRLENSETDLQRIQRLARLRHAAAEKPKELLFSDKPLRMLSREADELTFTRVGLAGQLLKKRALDLYSRLRTKSDPDRIGTNLKSLATILDELAALMADVTELATAPPQPTPLQPPVADGYLPSRSLAGTIRGLAKQQRYLHTQVTGLTTELARQLQPSVFTSQRRTSLWQLAQMADLVRNLDEFMEEATDATQALDPSEIDTLTQVAKTVKEARRQLTEAVSKAAKGNPADAETHRAAAEKLLHKANETLTAAAPANSTPAAGEALLGAERSMRKAIQHLAPDGNRAAAERAMRDASRALQRASTK